MRKLRLKGFKEWQAYNASGKRPASIPASPHVVYAGKGWTNWGDWLGTGNVRDRSIPVLPYEDGCAFARLLGLKNTTEWRAYCASGKRRTNIPADPYRVYAGKGWTNWGDWLGTGNIKPGSIPFLPYEEANTFVRPLGLKSKTKWHAYAKSDKRPANIPKANPHPRVRYVGARVSPIWVCRDVGWSFRRICCGRAIPSGF